MKYDGANWVPGQLEISTDLSPQLGANLDVQSFTITSTQYSGTVKLEGDRKTGFFQQGGNIELRGGDSETGNGGDIVIRCGESEYTGGVSGSVSIKGGYGTYSNTSSHGGEVNIYGGRVTIAGYNAGDVKMYAGNGSSSAGNPGDVVVVFLLKVDHQVQLMFQVML